MRKSLTNRCHFIAVFALLVRAFGRYEVAVLPNLINFVTLRLPTEFKANAGGDGRREATVKDDSDSGGETA